jgi:hypothetical protein
LVVADVLVQRDLQSDLFGSDAAIPSGVFFMDEFDGEDGRGLAERSRFLDAKSRSVRSGMARELNVVPCVGTLTNGLGDDLEWQVRWQRSQLRELHWAGSDLSKESWELMEWLGKVLHGNST